MDETPRSTRSWTSRTLGPMKRGSLRGSIFTLMSAAIGSGVLLLPYAFSLVGVPVGILTLLFGTYCLATSLRLIITISHITGRDSYAKSAIEVLGPVAGRGLACLMVGEALCGQAAFIKFLSDLWPRVLPMAFGRLSKTQMAFVIIFAAFPAAASKDMSVLRHVTVVSFFSLAFMASLVVSSAVHEPNVEEISVITSGTSEKIWYVLPQTWSLVLSALYCQHVAIPVYKQMNNFNGRRINKVLLRSCTSLSLLYALVATCGVMAHGAKTPENILLAYPSSHQAAWLAQLLTGCSLLIALPLGVQPARDQLPEVLYSIRSLTGALHSLGLRLLFGQRPQRTPSVSELEFPVENVRPPTGPLRVLHTAVIMSVAASLALIFPNVTSIVGIATGFGSVLWTFIMPMVMILILRHRAAHGKIDGAPLHIPGLGSSKRERLLNSPLASPTWSPRNSQRSSPTLSPAPSATSLTEVPNLVLEAQEDICMQIEEPDSGWTSTVLHSSTRAETGGTGGPPGLHGPSPVRDHYPWSFQFSMGILSLSIGSILGLTSAYQSLVKVL
ncbi:unnamed protein product [Durusdinium trenchii]|uniref:Uncharacterized protein n=3 Tax=Durusdinium trenchii TaxID=1381693 RepID=A0ABP0S063_9DINO